MLAKLSTRPAVRLRGCLGPRPGAARSRLPAAAADRPQPDLSRFYRQKPAWGACEGPDMPKDMQCAKVTVPLDYARPRAAPSTWPSPATAPRGSGRARCC